MCTKIKPESQNFKSTRILKKTNPALLLFVVFLFWVGQFSSYLVAVTALPITWSGRLPPKVDPWPFGFY